MRFAIYVDMSRNQKFEFSPIGYFHTLKKNKTDASRQPQCDFGSQGTIEITLSEYELALKELDGFSHLWIIFVFHQNKDWKPLTMPPRLNRKVGVLATRSPFRPNPIGMSCVKILSIKGNKIEIDHHDLLDGTPILDIKPYIEYADSISETKQGWTTECENNLFQVNWNTQAKKEVEFLIAYGVSEIENVVNYQLSFEPTDKKRKRIKSTDTVDQYVFAYRTWRVLFQIKDRSVEILKIFSGYTETDLASDDDPYHDKNIHLKFNKCFEKQTSKNLE